MIGLACLALGPHGEVGRAGGERCLESGTRDHTSPKFDIDMLVSVLKQENGKDSCVIKVIYMKYIDYSVIGSRSSTRYFHAMAYFIVKMYKHLKCKSKIQRKIDWKNIIKIAILPKAIYRFTVTPFGIPKGSSHLCPKWKKPIFNFIWNGKGPWGVKTT